MFKLIRKGVVILLLFGITSFTVTHSNPFLHKIKITEFFSLTDHDGEPTEESQNQNIEDEFNEFALTFLASDYNFSNTAFLDLLKLKHSKTIFLNTSFTEIAVPPPKS